MGTMFPHRELYYKLDSAVKGNFSVVRDNERFRN